MSDTESRIRRPVRLIVAAGILCWPLLTVGALIQAPASGQAAPQTRGPEGRISGRILSTDGTPLRMATVRLAASDVPVKLTTRTDASGRYEFTALPAGRYYLSAAKAGYGRTLYGQRRARESGSPIELKADARADGIDMRLPKGGVITGVVVDEAGEPMVDVTVRALTAIYFGGRRVIKSSRNAQTDDEGRFRIFGLDQGSYLLTARPPREDSLVPGAPATDFVETYYPGTGDLSSAQVIRIRPGEVASVVMAAPIVRARAVSGLVTDLNGAPLGSAPVLLNVNPSSNLLLVGPIKNTVTDASGRFRLSGVAPGFYELCVPADARYGGAFGRMPLMVTDQDETGVHVQLRAGGTIHGRVRTDEGGPPGFAPSEMRIVMAAMNPMDDLPNPVQVEDDWTFTVEGLGTPARIATNLLPGGWRLKSVLSGGTEFIDTPFDFSRRDARVDVELVLTRRASKLTATAVDDRDRPVLEWQLVVFSTDRSRWNAQSRFIRSARSDQQGRAEIVGLPEGDYLAVALLRVEEGAWLDPDFLEGVLPVGERITIEDGGSATLRLRLMAQ